MLPVGVIDYGRGNIHSVIKALQHLGSDPQPVSDPDRLAAYPALVLPGVGSFADAMTSLRQRGLVGAIQAYPPSGRPLLGICLGLQLLLERGTEGKETPGLGLLRGEVRRLEAGDRKVPHTGWNEVRFAHSSPLTQGLGDAAYFYFVHSFAAFPIQAADWLGSTTYGERFASVAGSGNVLGTQFHPEKSGRHGLTILRNFLRLTGGLP